MVIDLEVTQWLAQLGEPVAETCFPPRTADGKPSKVKVPYLIWLDEQTADGCDFENDYLEHRITIEHYTRDGNDRALTLFLLQSGVHFRRGEKTWLPTEQLYMTPFYLTESIFEKFKKE